MFQTQSCSIFSERQKSEKLHQLEKLGVLEKVEFSDWATPIVPVLKPDGSVRICGDYKATINPYLDVQEYTMPSAEELFTQLNWGEIDLSSAYQQVILDDDSKQYVTINTHLGLYRYTRLPFGVKVNPVNRSLSQDIPWSWSDDCQKSFETLKAALENSPLLTHYDSKKQEACYLMYCI